MERERLGVEPICRVLGVSASAYYQRATGKRSTRRLEDKRLLERIREMHAANYFAYGSWRMWKALLRAGEQVGRGRVERLMRANGIQGAKRRGKPWRSTYPTRLPIGRPTSSSATSQRPAPTSSGSRTSPTCAAGRALSTSPSWSTRTAARSSAGSSQRTCAPTSSSTRCGWRWRNAEEVRTSRACITATPAARADSTGRRNTS